MAEFKLIGKDYQTADIVAKVTGRAKYAEDFRAEGMLFAKLLLSPMPHGRVRSIDTSAAEAMDGVEAILTADDLPRVDGEEQGLTNEPVYQGEPILAVAAVDETIAADAVEKIRVNYERLPFAVDSLESLRPGGPNARLEGNAYKGGTLSTVKWTNADFAEMAEGRLPMGEPGEEWSVGDIDAGFGEADLVLDETMMSQSTSHQPMETRSAMAYWQNGKCYMHASTQSTIRTLPNVADWVGVDPDDVVLIAEYCGGGFGSKSRGAISCRIPAYLSKMTGRPVMMRLTRLEEGYIGRARVGFQGRARIGFRADGRVTALDLYIVQDAGPYGLRGDFRTGGRISSLVYQPLNMRWRGISVATNTPPRAAQRAPGGLQITAMLEPVIAKAARQLGIDQVEMRRINAPSGRAPYDRPDENGVQGHTTSAFVAEALDQGKAVFGWDERKGRSGQRNSTKVTGIGVGLSAYSGGSVGYDGLIVLRPDGTMAVHQGIGNLGTHSVMDTARAAAEALDFPWDQVEVVWGNTSKHLPWSSTQSGTQTIHAHTRANWAAGLDAKRKLQQLAAHDLGGAPGDYEVGGGRVSHRRNPSRYLSVARAAARAIQLAGEYDGHELPADINAVTTTAATALAGSGLVGVARDNYGRDGNTMSFVAGFAEVEIDVETGVIQVVEYTASADIGVVVHPRALGGQIHGGGIQGMGHARSQKWVFDPHWGLSVAKRFYSSKPPSILDVPLTMKWAAVGIPDPDTPIGAKGIGEGAIGAGAAAVLCAIADAIGDDDFRRTPILPDIVLTALEEGAASQEALTAHV